MQNPGAIVRLPAPGVSLPRFCSIYGQDLIERPVLPTSLEAVHYEDIFIYSASDGASVYALVLVLSEAQQ